MPNKICDMDLCTGCTACFSSCAYDAITMIENSDGFMYPSIDPNKCTKCNICKIKCPANNVIFHNKSLPECYAVMASDELRYNSSSGAVFPVLAEYVIANNGLVCGAAFDRKMNLEHCIVDNVLDLEGLKGSKYLQSGLGNIFREIKVHLEKDRLVMFTGTPCQNAGLVNFLGKEYDNLILVDFICHGVPSQLVFKKYLEDLDITDDIVDINFRDKRDGWNIGHFIRTIITKNDVKYSVKDEEDDFIIAFMGNISLRKCCHNCNFCKITRIADFTMGDFWGGK